MAHSEPTPTSRPSKGRSTSSARSTSSSTSSSSSVWFLLIPVLIINAIAVHFSMLMSVTENVSELDWALHAVAWSGLVVAIVLLYGLLRPAERETPNDWALLAIFAAVEMAIASSTTWYGHGSTLRMVIQIVTIVVVTWILWPSISPALSSPRRESLNSSRRSTKK